VNTISDFTSALLEASALLSDLAAKSHATPIPNCLRTRKAFATLKATVAQLKRSQEAPQRQQKKRKLVKK